ncbi:nuclear pore [Fusarium albosuccineum]|uniref:Nuclear pore n=1 Tax=Fusarium albosuccineum TaxID=1237068 RepID=A0A8H4LI68_9HYPO|nr:nuclear pore [Fusarium albosuccineum]
MPERGIIDFDPRADIKLKVGGKGAGSVVFGACSRALSRASPVFERMLYGNFIEARSRQAEGDEWIVELPEDKAEPFIVFLQIAHCRFNKVEKKLRLDLLYDLTVLTNYYDCTRLLEPWMGAWMSGMEDEMRKSSLNMAKALWISWEFGRKENFSRIARRMLMDSEGGMAIDDAIFLDLKMPPDIIERITAIRTQTIQALLDVCHDMVDNLLVVDEKPRWCRYAEWMGPHRCESMILGSLTFCLARAGLWPLPTPEDVPDSIVGLHRKMTGLIIHDIGEIPGTKPAVDHRGCNPGPYLLNEVEAIFKDIPSPITKFHLDQMDRQAKRLTQA